MTIDPVLATSAQAGAAAVVLLGAIAKLRAPVAFRDAVAGYRLLPDALVAPAALAIPLVEALGAAALLFPATRTAAAIGLIALLIAFAAALAANILRGRTDIDCGCTGLAGVRAVPGAAASGDGTPRRIGWLHVARVLLLVALVATALLAPDTRAVVWFDYLTLFFSVPLIVCALLTVDVLLANVPRLTAMRNS
ncbi:MULTISPECIES: MauE/DoxX family redox-associated membrane protein [Burkholderia]|uniref:MauE/DoxX family redox-associated membrane protein n=1 Tax=Burkholderia TaxID=32008 RepID=UPI00080B35FB|nr:MULTISPECIES: MauE/DoxX family redox-associated membrane protein [Burkholderia]MCA8479486.1 methylamine utilization protein MauE [Burkholderia multivorans]MDR9052882.1 Methylamine utilization protein MauE [Burkholderia multivorans]MDR9057105.1 Methylamine utilization protein MauE [Burkholderia multivorans]MDR9065270.1 Methylamine utilization protein MauE [Burkholderia multivorans]MDR9068909.1 Methylamine utilization protein MauE [Burkholderia multivorans]